jgi:hypothetical protein
VSDGVELAGEVEVSHRDGVHAPLWTSVVTVSRESSAKPPDMRARLTLCVLATSSEGVSSMPASARAAVRRRACRRRFPGEVGLVAEIRGAQEAASAPAVTAGDDGDDLVAVHGDDDEVVERVPSLDEADLGSTLADRSERDGGVHDVDLRTGPGVLVTEGGQPAGEQELADRVTGGERERVAGLLAVLSEGVLGVRSAPSACLASG